MNLKHGIAAAGFAGVISLMAGGAQASTVWAQQIDVSDGGAGWDASAPVFNTDRNDPGNALGEPDQIGNSEGGFYSPGRGGIMVFDFGTSFAGQASVFEVTFRCDGPQNPDGTCNFTETANVLAFNGDYTPSDDGSIDISAFTLLGSIANGDANTEDGAAISFEGPFRYLAIVDTTDRRSGDGFDVDAVSVTAVPLPASVLGLMIGMGGLGLMARRRTS